MVGLLGRHPVRSVLAAALLSGAVLVVGAALVLLSVRSDLERGRARLDGLDLDSLRAQGIEGALGAAAADLESAQARAGSPFLDVLAPVPVVGDQIRAVRDLTGAAADLGAEARTTGTRISAALDRAGADPGARVALLDVVLDELDRIEAVAAEVDVGSGGRLLPPLRTARTDVRRALGEVPERFAPLADKVSALRQLLSGPASYLIVVGNNAEMRAGAGMPLSAGVATFAGGDIELGDFRSTVRDMHTPDPTGRFNAHIAEELRETYPRWNLGRDFPETAVIPHFPVTAPIYADLAADTQGWEVDGVIHIDVMALARLLEVVGPVEVAGVEFSAESTPRLLLNEMYVAFEGGDQDQRRDVLGEVAEALFDAIQARDADLLDVVSALERSAGGRHLMAWSRDPVLQEMFVEFGASGAVSPFEALVSVQNTGANKLDWYIRPSVSVVAEPRPAVDEWAVTMTITLSHPDRDLTASYIEGPFPELAGGRHRTLVTAQLPTVATRLDMPDDEITELGHDGTSHVIGTRVVVPRGEDRRIVVTFALPRSFPGLAVVPSSRAFPVPWTVEGIRHDDSARFVAQFDPFPLPVDRVQVLASWTAVLLALAGLGFMASSARSAAPTPGGQRMSRVDATLGGGLFLLAFGTLLIGTAI